MPKIPIMKVGSGNTSMGGLTLGAKSPLTTEGICESYLTQKLPSLSTNTSLPQFQ